MKPLITFILTSFLGLTTALASLPKSYMVAANRSDSSISIIDTTLDDVVKEINKNSLGYEFEPMYASHLKKPGVFVVGDRKNNELMIFDDSTGKLLKREPLGKGVFHQWAQSSDKTVVIATDIDRGANVVTITRDNYNNIMTLNKRFDLSGPHSDGKPHDVVIDSNHFYLSIHDKNTNGDQIDKVLKVNRLTLEVEDSHVFSPDVHLGLPQKSPYLLVVEQSGTLNFLTRNNMKIVKQVTQLPGAHGIYWNAKGTRLFAANIASTGPNSIYEIKNIQHGFANLVTTADSEFSKPHNISVDFNNNRLYLTHSGSNDVISVYDITKDLKLLGTIQTGANPFGIGFVSK